MLAQFLAIVRGWLRAKPISVFLVAINHNSFEKLFTVYLLFLKIQQLKTCNVRMNYSEVNNWSGPSAFVVCSICHHLMKCL